ncbi:type II secretion system protein [Vibrio atypicus]|uniref:type II secretion system protein n=1 Tax=Vibrio atypicus TaxID=558271 RepID=UPI00135A890E|nr:type II secretion system protein [Vibrio atypicus]
MKRQGGFTLIELVVVIVILGILAVTAAPRFLNLQSDARASSLQGLKGAMQGAAGIVYGSAAINGQEATETVTAASSASNVALVWGYPAASADGIGGAVVGLADNAEWQVSGGATTAGASVQYTFSGDTPDWGCAVTYTAPSAEGDAPTVTAPDADDC